VSGDVELADGGFGRSFPAEWGRPKGSQFSEERAAWIREQVRRHVAAAPLRELAARDRRLLSVLRLAELERRREIRGRGRDA
jgi:hypothetical protein